MAALSQEQLASLTIMQETPAEQGVSQTPTASKTLSNSDLFNLTSSIIETPQQALRLSISMRRVRTIKVLIRT